MPHIQHRPLPTSTLLVKYAKSGAYTDCFATDIARTVSHAEFVEAFYTGGLFKLERLLLRVLLSKPSTDLQARQLAAGELNEFAAWTVEARAEDQLLLRAVDGRTRSWLMVAAVSAVVPSAHEANEAHDANRSNGTRLYFGSAVVPVKNASTSKSEMGFVFKALLGFHKLYSRALLSAAARRLS